LTRRIASLSLDLDNLWSYRKTHGHADWKEFPSYFDVLVPRVLGFLKARGLSITFFIVGQDAALEKNREQLAAIAAAGHEIGNHSFHHEPWMQSAPEADVDAELARAEEHIERATGRHPRGYRGPGYSLSPAILRVLARRGYLYDASTLPSYLGPLARAYYMLTADFSPEEKRKRAALFGKLGDGLQPLRPYRWHTDEGEVLELPVTTLPVLKLPFHLSYLVYLGSYSPALARLYFRTALAMCRASRVAPSLLLHPTDFLGREDTDALSFFPGMDQPLARKMELVGRIFDRFCHEFTPVTMAEHASQAASAPRIAVRQPAPVASH
jgi:hypothetical protein